MPRGEGKDHTSLSTEQEGELRCQEEQNVTGRERKWKSWKKGGRSICLGGGGGKHRQQHGRRELGHSEWRPQVWSIPEDSEGTHQLPENHWPQGDRQSAP